MLPTAEKYLNRAGFSSRGAAYSLIALFLSGVVVIRLFSDFIHHHIPSYIVDCTHTHVVERDVERGVDVHHDHQDTTEQTPLLSSHAADVARQRLLQQEVEEDSNKNGRPESIRRRISRQISMLMDNVKEGCHDDANECYGFSQACGQECSKIAHNHHQTPPPPPLSSSEEQHLVQHHHSSDGECSHHHHHHHHPHEDSRRHLSNAQAEQLQLDAANDFPESIYPPYQHHHHVPQNAFLSIGLQTSLAIALHKMPEGFITYATNHASPQLGMTVFLALFIHNITEGFAMALPLYLALDSRAKAILWSSILGGISQPAGAGIAALWIWASHKAGDGDVTAGPSWGVYGCMFAATAGIMTAVGLQLFCEGSELTHHRGLCIGFAVGGMALMGFSFALTA